VELFEQIRKAHEQERLSKRVTGPPVQDASPQRPAGAELGAAATAEGSGAQGSGARAVEANGGGRVNRPSLRR
jgi:hypothetical protein